MNLTIVEEQYIKTLKTIATNELSDKTENLIALVKKEIQNLPPRCKQMFLLSKKEGLTNIEIAEYLNITTKAVERQMTVAYSFIRKKVDDKTDSILFLLFNMNKKSKV